MAQHIMRPSDIYKKRPAIPPGWVYAGFHPPKVGEKYLVFALQNCVPTSEVRVITADCEHTTPFVIVRRKEESVEDWWE